MGRKIKLVKIDSCNYELYVYNNGKSHINIDEVVTKVITELTPDMNEEHSLDYLIGRFKEEKLNVIEGHDINVYGI